MKLFIILILSVSLVASFDPEFIFDDVAPKPAPAETYIVNLDLPPMKRWDNVMQHYNGGDVKTALHSLMNKYLPSKLLIPILETIASDLDRYIPQPFADEMRGISKSLGIKLGDIVLGNIIYDVSAFNSSNFKACTSIVALDNDGKIIHGRNLDYAAADLLKPLVMQVEYQRHGKSLFMATTYAGYIGVITGAKHDAFSISGDQRNKGKIWQNLLPALEESWPTFFLQRMVLENAEDYKSAIAQLVETPTIAPVYYIVGGIQPGEGAVIVKDRTKVLDVKSMNENWYILETNYDPWNKPPEGDDRRDAAINAMNKIGKNKMNPSELYKALSVHLVFNDGTTYTTIMSASDSSVYHTMIRYDHPDY